MSKDLLQAAKYLKNLLLNESQEIIDTSGRTKLIEKAQNNSRLNPLSAEKKFEEEVVCYLAKEFNQFDQAMFSKLDNYISVSRFSNEKITEAFKHYIYNEENDEDLVLKACVARSTQSLLRSSFTYDYLSKRFKTLLKLDPWLFIELIINCNWDKGVDLVEYQLGVNYDTSYLFSLLPEWISNETNKDEMSKAISKWYKLFNEQDKKIAEYYVNNHGYKILVDEKRKQSSAVENIIAGEGFSNFIHKRVELNYKTIPTC